MESCDTSPPPPPRPLSLPLQATSYFCSRHYYKVVFFLSEAGHFKEIDPRIMNKNSSCNRKQCCQKSPFSSLK